MTFTQPQPVNQRRYGDQGLVDRNKCSDITAEVERPENYQIRDITKKTDQCDLFRLAAQNQKAARLDLGASVKEKLDHVDRY